MTDLSEFLPPGAKPRAKAPKVSLTEFLPQNTKVLEPEIFSPPRALELHLCRTTCRCGETYVTPEGVFVEVTLKKLHTVGFNHYYKEVGQVLIPLASERSEELRSIQHRTRVRETRIVVCHMCLDRADLYQDPRPQSHHEWEIRRPTAYSEAWARWQLENTPSRAKLLELIEQIERREALKDDEKFQPGRVERMFHKIVDPEKQWEE